MLVPFGRGGRGVDRAVLDDHAVDGPGRFRGHFLLPHVPGDRVGLAGQGVAVATAALPGHREDLAGGQIAGGVVLPGFERVADLRQGAGHLVGGEHLLDAAVPGDDIQPGVAGMAAAQPGVLRDGLAGGGQDEAHRHARAVRGDRHRRGDAAAVAAGSAGVWDFASPQGQDGVEELGHLDVGDTAHRDAEQPAGVDSVGVRPGAVPAGHRLHDDVEERRGLLAAFVETGDDRGVPGAAAGGLDVLAQFQGPVEHAGQALGDQAAGQPGGADRAAADGGRERGVVEGAFLGDQVEAAHQAPG